MYKFRSLLAAIAFTTLGLAQSDRGTITGPTGTYRVCELP